MIIEIGNRKQKCACGGNKKLSTFWVDGVLYYRCLVCRHKSKKKYMATKKGREMKRRVEKRYRERHRIKVNAKGYIARGVRSGRIKRPSRCSFCGDKRKPQGHHSDYSKPLEVRWLCQPCHRLADKRLI